MKRSISVYFSTIFNCLTQLLNNILGGMNSNQSLSERCHINTCKGRPGWKYLRNFVNFCAFMEDDHCRKAHIRELKLNRGNLRQYGVYVGSIKASPYYGGDRDGEALDE